MTTGNVKLMIYLHLTASGSQMLQYNKFHETELHVTVFNKTPAGLQKLTESKLYACWFIFNFGGKLFFSVCMMGHYPAKLNTLGILDREVAYSLNLKSCTETS